MGYLTLGPVTFDQFEVPESINFGGQQRIAKHQLVGGARQVNVLGPDPDDKSWSGRFRGANAVSRAQTLEQLCIAGQVLTLSWETFTYQVVISYFKGRFLRAYEIDYDITVVQSDGETPAGTPAQPVDALISSDLGGVGSLISDAQSAVTGVFSDMTPFLTEAASGLSQASTAVGALGTLAGKSVSQVAPLITDLQNANTAIGGAIDIGDGNILTGAQQIGGVIPGSPTGSASSVTQQIAALGTLSNLIVARGQTGRAISNATNAGAAA